MKNSIIIVVFLASITCYSQTKEITLADIWTKNTFKAEGVIGIRSMNDGKTYSAEKADTVTKTKDLIKYNYATGQEVTTIVKGIDLKSDEGKPIEYDDYSFSNDEKLILFTTERSPLYRHSFKAKYYAYNLVEKKLYDLSKNGMMQLASFSPDGQKVAFVRDNNLYVEEIKSGIETMISKDGKFNSIINGAPDWVYEEEFSFSKAYEWSPDGKKIAWFRFDESKVKEFSLTLFDSLYPREVKYKYPKAGEDNSIVEIHIYDFEKNKSLKAEIGNDATQYIPRIKWSMDPNTLCISRMNRLQNKLELLLCDANSGNCNVLYTETSETYIDISDDLTFLSDKKHFIISAYKDGYNQLLLYDMNGKMEKQLTTDKKNVLAFYGFNEKTQTCFYQSFENSPCERQVYSINLKGDKKLLGHADGINTPEFSSGQKFLINRYSIANKVTKYELYNINGKMLKILEGNDALTKKLAEYMISPKEFMEIKLPNNISLQAWMIKPMNFNVSKKYPVLMYVYGGPGAPTVMNGSASNNDYWFQVLAQKGYIIVSVDNRGTTPKDEQFLKCTYKQLGKLECEDQIAAAKYLGNLPYVNKDRIGIWGWSYGGYMTSLCMAKGADVFKAGIAVAPVTNWRYYDSIYTERYLRTPQENASGYDDNSPINFAEKIKGKFLLVHGVADDNVHYQNSMMFVNKLIKNNIQFETMNYPNRNHGISGGGARLHLYTMMTKFIEDNL